MKLSTAIVALSTLASAAAVKISSSAAQKLVRTARRVEEAQQQQQEEDYAFLGYYDAKVVGCKKNLETPLYAEDGSAEYEAVLIRLCPSDSCDSGVANGCKSGYGEMMVPLASFVDAYFEDQRDNMQWDDMFQVDKFARCEQYNPDENADDANKGAWENYQFFIGPTCSDDGDIKLAVFSDEDCTQASEYDFETISNGWTLPYGSGGLVSTMCNSCTEYNDNGEVELRQICQNTYQQSPYKCESGMEHYSYFGQNVQGCEMISSSFPATKKGSSGGKIFGWVVFTLVVVGLAGYIVWWRKKKAATSE